MLTKQIKLIAYNYKNDEDESLNQKSFEVYSPISSTTSFNQLQNHQNYYANIEILAEKLAAIGFVLPKTLGVQYDNCGENKNK
jgi:hypothetical protein